MENQPVEARAEDDIAPPEKLKAGSQSNPGSEGAVSAPVAPKYKQDPETTGDLEKGDNGSKLEETSSTESHPRHGAINEYHEDDDVYESGIASRYWRKYRPFGHAFIWLLVTAYTSR